MSFFCPRCANLLLSNVGTSGQTVFQCQTCPYVYNIELKITKAIPLPMKKQVDDVLGSEEDWKNVDQTSATCEKCANTTAYFLQVQIRSADEPSTIFYRCTKCANMWKEG